MRISVAIFAMSLTVLVTGCQSSLLRDSFTWKRDAASSNPVADNKAAFPPAVNPAANPRPAFNNPALAQQQLPPTNSQVDSELQKGTTLFNSQRITEAQGHLETVVKLDPQNATAHHMLAQINDQNKKFDKAEQHYLAAMSAQPNNVSVLCNLGWSYAQQDRPDEARHYLARALYLDPGHQTSLLNLGSLAVEMGHNGEAMGYFRRVTNNNEDEANRILTQELGRKADKLKNLAKKSTTTPPSVKGKSFQEVQHLMQQEKEKQHSLQAAADRAVLELEQFERNRRNQILATGGQLLQQENARLAGIPEQDINREMYQLDQDQKEQYRDQRRNSVQRGNAPMIVDSTRAGDYDRGQPLPPNGGASSYQSQPSYGRDPNDWAQTPNQGLPPIPGAPLPNTGTGQYASNQSVAPGFDPNGFAAGANMNPNMQGQGSYQSPVPNQPPPNWQGQQFGQPNNFGNGFVAAPNIGQSQPGTSQYYGEMPNLPTMNPPSGNYQPAMPNPSNSGAWAPGQNYGYPAQSSGQQATYQQAPAQSSVDPARQALDLVMSAGPGALFQLPSGTGYEAQRPANPGFGAQAAPVQQYPPNAGSNMSRQGLVQQPQFGNQPGSAPPNQQPEMNRYRATPNWQNQGAMPPATGPRMP